MALFGRNKDEYEEYAPDNNSIAPKKPLALRILGIFFKVLFWSVIVLINGVMLWRVFSSGDPRAVRTVSGNADLKSAYEAYLADTDENKAPFAVYQREHKTITDELPDEEEEKTGNYGYFALTDVAIFPRAGQVQVVFRYNDSTLDALVKDYSLDFKPDRKNVWYDVTARIVYDATPDIPNDDRTTVRRISPSSASPAWKTLYTYEQLTFSGIENFKNVDAIYIDFYYINDADYAKDPYGTLCIYLDNLNSVEYKLDRKDISSITSGGN